MSSQSENSGSTNAAKYKITGSGTNRQGNHWCSRDYGPGSVEPNPYHYSRIENVLSNQDDSWFYKNPDGSKYYNNGKGFVKFDKPDGGGFTEINGKRTYKKKKNK